VSLPVCVDSIRPTQAPYRRHGQEWRIKWPKAPLSWLFLLVSLLILVPCGCKPNQSVNSESDPSSETSTPVNMAQVAAPSEGDLAPKSQLELWKKFDGARALEVANALISLGPRPAGSDPLNRARQLVLDDLSQQGWSAVQQRFTGQLPDGKPIEFCNLIARLPRWRPARSGVAVTAYLDTPRTDQFRDVGATDGAANSAILVELGRVLAMSSQLGSQVELIFLDGHSPFQQLGLNDGLFGSRFYMQTLQINQNSADIQAVISLGNVGGRDFRLNFAPNSDAKLVESFRDGAKFLGFKLEAANRSFLADHVAFQQAGIPALALLDADSPYINTADDNSERLAASSLGQTGSLLLYFLCSRTAATNR
jgi:peptidase M28-like protein